MYEICDILIKTCRGNWALARERTFLLPNAHKTGVRCQRTDVAAASHSISGCIGRIQRGRTTSEPQLEPLLLVDIGMAASGICESSRKRAFSKSFESGSGNVVGKSGSVSTVRPSKFGAHLCATSGFGNAVGKSGSISIVLSSHIGSETSTRFCATSAESSSSHCSVVFIESWLLADAAVVEGVPVVFFADAASKEEEVAESRLRISGTLISILATFGGGRGAPRGLQPKDNQDPQDLQLMQLTQLVQVKLLQNYVNASQLGWATRANRSREPSSSMAAAEVLEPVEPCSGAFLATEWLRGLCVLCVAMCVCVCMPSCRVCQRLLGLDLDIVRATLRLQNCFRTR